MKKKIVAMCLVVALAVVAIGGATLAYFTDKDQVVNTFTIGDVDIDLYEYTDYNGDGVRDTDKKFQEHIYYSDIMPGDEMVKVPVIENTSTTNDAYVRVAVVMNNLSAINTAIDDVYEKKTKPETDEGYTDEEIQKIYDYVFNGWGINYTKREDGGRRMWMGDRTKGEDSPVLYNVDMIGKVNENYAMVDMNNQFQTEEEKAKFAENSRHDGILDVSLGDPQGYYWNAAQPDERVYVFYLKLKAGESYELFQGLNVPADFDEAQLDMFKDLSIGIYADAIQTANFVDDNNEPDPVAAFNALEEAHPLGWWNATVSDAE